MPRNSATRLRAKLREYYLTAGLADPVEIDLPKGGYVPEFRLRAEAEPAVVVARPERRLWMAAGGALALTAAVAVGYWLGTRGPEAVGAPVRFHIAPLPGQELASLASAGPVAMAPDGSRVAFRAGVENSPLGMIYVRELGSLEVKPLIPRELHARDLFWSPDSKSLGFASDNDLATVRLGSAAVTQVARVAGIRGASWGEPGEILFANQPPGGIHAVPAGGGAPRPVTRVDAKNGEISHSWPQFLPGGRRFLFFIHHAETAKTGIYLGELDGAEERRLVVRTPSRGAYSGGPDSGRLLYVAGGALMAQRFRPGRGTLEGDPVQLESGVGTYEFHRNSDFSASSQGHLVLRPPAPSPLRRLIWLDRTGRVADELPGEALYRFPEISPDGRSVAVEMIGQGQATGGIWLLGLLRQPPVQLSVESRQDCCPVWSPDGARIVFSSSRKGPGALFWRPSHAGPPDEPLHDAGANERPTSWSARHRLVLLHHRTGQTTDIWGIEPGSGKPSFPIISTPADEQGAVFSPDGGWIAYYSDEPKPWSVYVERYPVASPRHRILVSEGVIPRWRADGRELYFVNGGKMMASQVEMTGGGFRVTAQRALFELGGMFHRGFGYAVTGDGSRFLVSAPVPGKPAPQQPVVLLNGLAK